MDGFGDMAERQRALAMQQAQSARYTEERDRAKQLDELKSLNAATDKLAAATAQLGQTMDNVDAAVMLVNSSTDSVETAVRDLDRNMGTTLANVNKTLREVHGAVGDLQTAVRSMDRSTTRLQLAALVLTVVAIGLAVVQVFG